MAITLPDTAIAKANQENTDPSCRTIEVRIVQDKISTKGTYIQLEVPFGKTIVDIPDMFVSFMATPIGVNPFYAEVKVEADAWIKAILKVDENYSKRITKTDFSWFASVNVPKASKDGCHLLADWGNWVFPFDDNFDDGDLAADPINAQKLVDDVLSGIRGEVPAMDPVNGLAVIQNSVWDRAVKMSPKAPNMNPHRRYAEAMEDYCRGVLEHVEDSAEAKIPSLDDFVEIRRRACGVMPIIALVELIDKIEIPDEFHNHHSIQEIKRVTVDVVLINNDILSYPKEENDGVAHNIIAVLRNQGMSTQEAFNESGSMLRERYRDWFLAQAALPQWGEDVDAQVLRLITGCRNIMLANLHWHYQSDRYFSKAKEAVRLCRIVIVNDDSSVTNDHLAKHRKVCH